MTNIVFSASGATTNTASLLADQADKIGSLANWWTVVGSGYADAAAALAAGWVLIDLRNRAGVGPSVNGRRRRLKIKLAGTAAGGSAISCKLVTLQSEGGDDLSQQWHQQSLATIAGVIGAQTGVAGTKSGVDASYKYATGLGVSGADGTAAYGGVRIVGDNADEAHVDLLDDNVAAIQVTGAAGSKIALWAEVGC